MILDVFHDLGAVVQPPSPRYLHETASIHRAEVDLGDALGARVHNVNLIAPLLCNIFILGNCISEGFRGADQVDVGAKYFHLN